MWALHGNMFFTLLLFLFLCVCFCTLCLCVVMHLSVGGILIGFYSLLLYPVNFLACEKFIAKQSYYICQLQCNAFVFNLFHRVFELEPRIFVLEGRPHTSELLLQEKEILWII